MLHFSELHIGSSTSFVNYFLKCFLVKIILIPFNGFLSIYWYDGQYYWSDLFNEYPIMKYEFNQPSGFCGSPK